MRKIVLLTMLGSLFIIETLNAQINKGSILLGGNFGFSQSTSGDEPNEMKQNNFYLSPSLGYTIKQNKVIGLDLNFSNTKQVEGGQTKNQNNSYGAGIFYRQYFPVAKRFYLFGEANAGYSKYEQEYFPAPNYINKQTINNFAIGLHPGISYAIHNKFHLEFGLNNILNIYVSNTKNELITPITTTTNSSKGFGINTNLSAANPFNVGFRFVLGK